MKKVPSGGKIQKDVRSTRRAALYARRERQLFLRKAAVVSAVVCSLLLLIGLRAWTALTSYVTPAPAQDLSLSAAAVHRAMELVPETVSDETPETLTDALPLCARTEAFDRAMDAYRYYDGISGYKAVAVTERSADAAAFFAGYEPRVTESTVSIPAPEGTGVAYLSATRTQGSDNTQETVYGEDWDEVFLESAYAVLIDLDEGVIVAERGADRPVYPASMAKILTLLVASEQIEDRSGNFTITQDIVDTTWRHSLSSVCWEAGETVLLSDMEHGTILPSGADAAIALARYAVGNEEILVSLMNERMDSMRLSEHANFTNVTGMHDDAMHCTVTDMAMILKAAVENAHVRNVLAATQYTATATPQHPDGIFMFNMFLDRTASKRLPGRIVCAKTGYTDEALNCAASYFISNSGKHYICVTAYSHGQMRTVTDHVNLYNTYTK
ncbi:MAG: D-alanyl-D-alanine carboxypeptidase [Lachnospiraceae bacterium]|nr:D-alanyl-D-alanine carboxypeptidase [Lachnospiraceae bacterium]